MNVFACHLLGAGVWRPPSASCPRGANPAWGGHSGGRQEIANLQAPTAKAESPKQVKQTEDIFDPEKECNELLEGTESEEDPWTGMDMDDDEDHLPKAQRFGKDAGGDSNPGPDQEGRRLPDAAWLLEEIRGPTMRWCLSPGCSEPRPRQAEIRIADDV